MSTVRCDYYAVHLIVQSMPNCNTITTQHNLADGLKCFLLISKPEAAGESKWSELEWSEASNT